MGYCIYRDLTGHFTLGKELAMMQPPSQQSISGTLTRIVFFLAVVGVVAIFGFGIFLGVVFASGL